MFLSVDHCRTLLFGSQGVDFTIHQNHTLIVPIVPVNHSGIPPSSEVPTGVPRRVKGELNETLESVPVMNYRVTKRFILSQRPPLFYICSKDAPKGVVVVTHTCVLPPHTHTCVYTLSTFLTLSLRSALGSRRPLWDDVSVTLSSFLRLLSLGGCHWTCPRY